MRFTAEQRQAQRHVAGKRRADTRTNSATETSTETSTEQGSSADRAPQDTELPQGFSPAPHSLTQSTPTAPDEAADPTASDTAQCVEDGRAQDRTGATSSDPANPLVDSCSQEPAHAQAHPDQGTDTHPDPGADALASHGATDRADPAAIDTGLGYALIRPHLEVPGTRTGSPTAPKANSTINSTIATKPSRGKQWTNMVWDVILVALVAGSIALAADRFIGATTPEAEFCLSAPALDLAGTERIFDSLRAGELNASHYTTFLAGVSAYQPAGQPLTGEVESTRGRLLSAHQDVVTALDAGATSTRRWTKLENRLTSADEAFAQACRTELG